MEAFGDPEIDRVLLATDFSRWSSRAEQFAFRLARNFDAEVLAVYLEYGLTVGGVERIQGPVVVFDNRYIDVADFAEVRDEFEADVAKAHGDGRVGKRRRVEDIGARIPVDGTDAGQFGHVERRPGGDHDVVRFDGSIADGEGAVVDEPRPVVDELDPFAFG